MVYFDWYSCRVFGRKIVRGGGMGLLVNLIVGIIGGVLGGWLFGIMGIWTTGCYREFDHGDRGGDCVAGDCFVVQ